jgi:hypothetical protein
MAADYENEEYEEIEEEIDEPDELPIPFAEDLNPRELQQFTEQFADKVRELAVDYIDKFFGDKKLCSGGKIPKYMLHCPKRISMVMNYDIVKGVNHAYRVLREMATPEKVKRASMIGEATDDIKLVNETLNLLSRSGVPQQFAGGMMILYLEFCEGVHCNGI